MFASKFGAGDILDSYYVAFRLPDFIFNLLILGTLSVAFIPVFSEQLQKDKTNANLTASTIINSALITISVICFFAYIFCKDIVQILVPGFTGEKLENTIYLTRLFLLSPIIFTLSNFFTSILTAKKKFLLVSLAPILYNLGIIIGLQFLFPIYGIKGLGLGVILGALMHLIIQTPQVFISGFRWKLVINLKDKAFMQTVKLFIPKVFGLDNSQISLLIGSFIGSFLASGSISILQLAGNLQAVPLGIFAISISTATFPYLTEAYAKKDEKEFLEAFKTGGLQILYIIIPISILIYLLRAYIVRIAYGAGQFSWEDTILTLKTLGILSFALIPQSINFFISKAFYARQNTKIPVFVNSFIMIINGLLAWNFGKIYGVYGIAIGFSVSSLINSFFLIWLFKKHIMSDISLEKIMLLQRKFVVATLKILLSSIFSGLAVYGSLFAFDKYLNTTTGIGLLIQAGLSATVGGIIYLLLTVNLKIEQAKKFTRIFYD